MITEATVLMSYTVLPMVLAIVFADCVLIYAMSLRIGKNDTIYCSVLLAFVVLT